MANNGDVLKMPPGEVGRFDEVIAVTGQMATSWYDVIRAVLAFARNEKVRDGVFAGADAEILEEATRLVRERVEKSLKRGKTC